MKKQSDLNFPTFVQFGALILQLLRTCWRDSILAQLKDVVYMSHIHLGRSQTELLEIHEASKRYVWLRQLVEGYV